MQLILDEIVGAVDNGFSSLAEDEEDMALSDFNIASSEERSHPCFEGAWM